MLVTFLYSSLKSKIFLMGYAQNYSEEKGRDRYGTGWGRRAAGRAQHARAIGVLLIRGCSYVLGHCNDGGGWAGVLMSPKSPLILPNQG